ncbi:hypothetical protein [Paenibacillus sanguinis]|uniref:hypothetical protein n=1 Tax=Paenibacillus sanguinis TaxID=225906 RepID=UPI000373EB0A|nr:hypothetical protein [Paenibacillus sanguinis]
MEDGQLFTWDALGTMAGASLLVYFVVQYTKGIIDRFARWLPTDIYAVLTAWIVLSLAQLAMGDADAADWRVYVLAFANAFLVAAAAGQMQHKAINPPGKGDDKAV